MEEYISDAGHSYTIDEINQTAKEYNTTFEDIIKKNKLTLKSKKKKSAVIEEPGKPKSVAKEDVSAAVKSTASKSVKPSSVSQDKNSIEPTRYDIAKKEVLAEIENYKSKEFDKGKRIKYTDAQVEQKIKYKLNEGTPEDIRQSLKTYPEQIKKDVQEFRLKTAFTPEKIAELDAEFEDYSKPKTYKYALGETTTKPFAKEINEIRSDPRNSGLTESEILEAAKKNKKRELAADAKLALARDYMNSISMFGKSEKQRGIESYVETEKKYFKAKEKKDLSATAALNIEYQVGEAEYNKATSELAEIDPKKLKSPIEIEAYNNKIKLINNLAEDINITQTALNKSDEEFTFSGKRIESANLEFDAAKRHYGLENPIVRTLDTFKNFGAEIILVAGVAADLGTYIPRALTSIAAGLDNPALLSEATKAWGIDLASDVQKQEEYFEKDTSDNGVNMAKHAGNLLISQFPNIILTVFSGGTSAAALETATVVSERAIAANIITKFAVSSVEKNGIARLIGRKILNEAEEAAAIKVIDGIGINGAERALLRESLNKAVTTSEKNAFRSILAKATEAEAIALPEASIQASLGSAAVTAAGVAGESSTANALSWALNKVKITTPSEMGIFASSMGGKVSEELYTNSLPATEGGTNFSGGEILLSSALWGLAETVGEKTQLKLMGGWGRTINAALSPSTNLVKDIANVQFKNVFKKGVGIARTQLNEQASEQVTNLFQNTIDKHLLNKNVGYLDNTGTVFKDTALLTGLMTSVPHIAGAVIKPFLVTGEQKQITTIRKKMMPLLAELQKPISKERKKIIIKQIKELTVQGSELHQKAIQSIGDMSINSWNTVVNNVKTLGQIKLQAKTIFEGSSENKKLLLENLQQKYNEVNRSTSNILSKTRDLNDIGLFGSMAIEDRRVIVENLTEIARLEQLGKGNASTASLHSENIKKLKDTNSDLLLNNSNKNLEQIIASVNRIYGDLGETTSKVIDVNSAFIEEKEKKLKEDSIGKTPEEVAVLKKKLVEDLKKSNVQEVNAEFKRLKTERYNKDIEGKSPEAIKKLKKRYDDELAQFDADTKGANVNAFNVSMPRVDENGDFVKDKRGRIISDDVILTNKRVTEASAGSLSSKGLDAGTKASHELLHVLFAKAFGIDQNAFVPMANALVNYIAKENPRLGANIKAYIDASYETSTEGIKAEELIVLVSELISTGELKYNESFFKKVGIMITTALNNVLGIPQINMAQGVKLNSGKDVYDFLGSYGKSFSSGELSPEFKQAIEIGVSGKLLKGAGTTEAGGRTSLSKSVEERIDDLYDAWNAQEISDKQFEDQLKVLEEEEANGPSEKQIVAKKEIVKKEPTGDKVKSRGNLQNLLDTKYEGDPKKLASEGLRKTPSGGVTNDFSRSVIGKELGGTVETITRRLYDPIAADAKRGVTRDEYKDALIQSAALLINNEFNPEKQTLDKFISSRLNLRANALAYELGIEGATKGGIKKDVEEQKALMAEETSIEVKEKPKYKNALESKVFAPEVLESATKKIISVVRTLKSRIDAPISLNRTVTPLISEIRDEIGKQLDIDVKTAMGGKKDNQLQNWLLDNKQYVLENMTTTWLMGKDGQGGMPIAIQKQIDGKWTNFPEWVGKKIDREKTTTDQAGRTSGAELVRRLPNVNNNISDSQFLDQIIGPDGNPLRGRKESLAKAVAEETAFDIINEDLANGGIIFEALSANQQRQGVEIAENFAIDFERQADRGNVKFSKELKLKLAERLGKDVNNKVVVNKIVEMIQDIIKPTIYKRNKALRAKEISLRDELGNDLYEELYDEYLSPIADALETVRTAEAGKRGNIAEEEVIRTLKNVNNKDFKVISVKAAGTGSDAIDVKFAYKGLDINFEVKSSKNDRITSLNVHNYANKKKLNTSRSLNQKNKKGLLDQIEKNEKFSSFVKKALEGGATITENGSLEVDQKLLNELTPGDNTLYKKTLISGNDLNIPMELVADINNRKGINYIGFGDIGIFYIGGNPLKLKVPALEGKLYSKAFLHAGKLKVNGKITLTLKVYTQLTTATSNELVEKSKASIYSPESWNTLFNSIPDNRIEYLKNINNVKTNAANIEAIVNSSKLSKTPKGISVFDFDDTVGITKSNVLYTMPDGSKGKLNAEEFAKEGASMLEAGAVFDFSEFSKVVDGKPGPMVEKMKKMIDKFGPENFFILTARPANAAGPIHEFLSSIGIDIPLENITGLGSSLAQSKADWMTAKAAEGYNDFYFSDDAIQNVDAVKNALAVLDVKSKIQQAKIKFSKTISTEFNKIIEENKGMEHYKVFSDIVARRRGKSKNKYDFYVPPSAADFELLLYNFLGKGERGEEQQRFFNEALLKPYANGNDLMDAARQSIKKDYKALLDSFPDIRKKMETLTPDGDYTYDQAIRVAMWNEEGVEIPGISERDSRKLTDLVNNDPELAAFKQGLIVTGRQGKGWINPTEYWDANTIIADLHGLTEGEGRKKFLAEFIDNAEQMFGTWSQGKLIGPNINKVEAVYGTNVREAIEDVLYRMTTGKNRSQGKDKETSAWSNWVNGSTGAIMFLNTRSAALQLIGAVNFLNLRDNNPIAAGKAFLNQPQYWKDFSRIWNSDKMKERRGGLKEDVTAAEIANAAAGSKNKPAAVIAYLLKIGYTPTQLADSFAIASGGAPFYRNRVKSYLKEGLTEQEAEDAAWSDFTKVSDETQQSGDPRDISKQQASGAGRLLLTFQNTAMQQSRIVKKSYLDLRAGRGNAKTHISKIVYYLAVQNTLFAVLQQGLFAVAFDDDDEEKDTEKEKAKKKTTNERLIDVADGVLDTVLRGTGFAGGVVSVLKNMTKKYLDEKDKNFKADYAKVVLEGANISPPIGSKLRKVYTGLQQTKFERDLIKERGWGVMQDGRIHLGPMYGVTGKLVEATTNLPMDRLVNKIENISQAMNSENQAWQRVAVGVGFTPYSVGIEESKGDIEIRAKAKEIRKEEGEIKSAETRQRTRDSIKSLPMEERMRIKREAALKRREKKKKRKMG